MMYFHFSQRKKPKQQRIDARPVLVPPRKDAATRGMHAPFDHATSSNRYHEMKTCPVYRDTDRKKKNERFPTRKPPTAGAEASPMGESFANRMANLREARGCMRYGLWLKEAQATNKWIAPRLFTPRQSTQPRPFISPRSGT